MKFTLGDASSDLKVLSGLSYAVGFYGIVVGGLGLLLTSFQALVVVCGSSGARLSILSSLFLDPQVLITFLYLVCGFALFYAGRYMARRVHFWRVVVCSIVGLFLLPFGLAVGGITLSVMTRKTVREIFAA